MKRPTNNSNHRNFVAKHMKHNGSGIHRPKKGPHASRARQKTVLQAILKVDSD